MLEFERKVAAYIKKQQLIMQGDYIVAAVSGGPDSMAMLDFLFRRKGTLGIKLAVVHVDHMLRGEASLHDLHYVEQYCKDRNIIFKGISINIKEKMQQDKRGMQETARTYRYQFFKKVMEEIQANKLSVAQHGDDQIETILMRLTRGSSHLARAGIQPMRRFGDRGKVIRPLLAVSKDHILEYCSYYGIEPRIDLSNEKRDYTRNRFRLDFLPFLKKENPNVVEHIQRFSEELSEDERFLERLAEKEFNRLCQLYGKEEIRLNIPLFLQIPMPLQRRVIHLILNYLYQHSTVDLSSTHTELLLRLVQSEHPSGKLDLPNGLRVTRSYDICIFTYTHHDKPSPYYFELNVGEELILPNGKTIGILAGASYSTNDPNILTIHSDDVQFPIIIRTREPGDKIRVKGSGGSKKIRDLFIDEKVPLDERVIWPIVTNQAKEILWVPGLKKSHFDLDQPIPRQCFQIRYGY